MTAKWVAVKKYVVTLSDEERERLNALIQIGSPADLFKTVGVDGPTASITCQSRGANDQNWRRP